MWLRKWLHFVKDIMTVMLAILLIAALCGVGYAIIMLVASWVSYAWYGYVLGVLAALFILSMIFAIGLEDE